MPHIHYALDWTVGAFIVHQQKVLLIDHESLGCWLCPGGHVELHEDPIEAVFREVKEEVGLEIEIWDDHFQEFYSREQIVAASADLRQHHLPRPRFMDRHVITETHSHIGLFYLARPIPDSDWVRGEYVNHHRWFSYNQLCWVECLPIWPTTRNYAIRALEELHNL